MTTPPLDRRRFLALMAAALVTGTAGVLKLLDGDPSAAALRRARGKAAGGDVANGTSTSTSGATAATAAGDGDTDEVAAGAALDDGILVLITLHGGNDALNTVV